MSDHATTPREMAEKLFNTWVLRFPALPIENRHAHNMVDAITAALAAAVAGAVPDGYVVVPKGEYEDLQSANARWCRAFGNLCKRAVTNKDIEWATAEARRIVDANAAIRSPETAQAGEATEKETDREAR